MKYQIAPIQSVDLPTGITMAYRRYGVAGARPVLMVHGVTGTSVGYTQIAQVLTTEIAVDIVAVDLRGHGQSSKPDGTPYWTRQHTDDIVALIDTLGLPPVHLVGHSLGSLIGQDFAARYPAKAASLTLIATGTGVNENATLAGLQEMSKDWDKPEYAGVVNAEFLNANWWPDAATNEDPDFRAALLEAVIDVPPYAWRLAFLGCETYPEEVSAIAAPVQIIFGTEDVFFTREQQFALINGVSSATILYQEWRNHIHDIMWPADNGKRIGHDIASFLKLIG
jgi:pimeloyl-ACP methyl ester carboxylesterase